MCAGSLVSGCWFSGHCFEIAVISGAGAVIFGAQNIIWQAWWLHFGTLGHHFGTLGEPWEAIGAAERTPGIQSWIFMDFRWILGSYFASFSDTLKQHWYLFSCFFPGYFPTIFWYESGRMELGNQAFGVRGCAETHLSQMSGFC